MPETSRSASFGPLEQDSAFTEAFNSVTPVSMAAAMSERQQEQAELTNRVREIEGQVGKIF